jgi:endonuclease/exonuclease/phosphatase family metal-dependent hydrolase
MNQQAYSIITILLFIVMPFSLIGQPIGVMSYNIRYDNPGDGDDQWANRKEAVVELIKYYQPSVLGLQEALHHQLAFMDESLTAYTFVGVGRDDGQTKGEYSPIFYDTTRLQLMEQATFWLSETPDKVSVGWDAAMERICTYALFYDIHSSYSFWVFNTHFDHKGEEARANSALLILSKIKELNTKNLPVILMGDLNAVPNSTPIQHIIGAMVDASTIADKPFYGPIGTFNGFEKMPALDKRIDYIFSQGFEVHSYAHLDDRYEGNRFVSDHLPVFAVIEINP